MGEEHSLASRLSNAAYLAMRKRRNLFDIINNRNCLPEKTVSTLMEISEIYKELSMVAAAQQAKAGS